VSFKDREKNLRELLEIKNLNKKGSFTVYIYEKRILFYQCNWAKEHMEQSGQLTGKFSNLQFYSSTVLQLD